MTDLGIKIIRYGREIVPDDPSMAYLVKVRLDPPQFMQTMFFVRHGPSEELVVRCATRDAVDRLLDILELRDHVRLQWIRIAGPGGSVEKIGPPEAGIAP